MPAHKLTEIEKAIIAKLGKIKYGKPGRPSNNKKALVAKLAAVNAYWLQKQQLKDEQK